MNSSKEGKFLAARTVTTLIEDSNEKVWIGTVNSGLGRYDHKNDTISWNTNNPDDPESISHNYVYSVLEDWNGTVWAGTEDGVLSKINRDSGKVEARFKNPILISAPQGLIQDSVNSDLLWFGTGTGGLFKFNKKTGQFKQFRNIPDQEDSLSSNSVGDLFMDKKGKLWISTLGGGLNLFDRSTESFIHFTNDPNDPESIGSNEIRDCFTDTNGNFWISCSGGGLNRLEDIETKKFKRFGRANGFSTETIFSILEDHKGHLWLSSDSGLFEFHPLEEKVLNQYMESDGLLGNGFSFFPTSALKTRDGALWFAGAKGINRFFPEKIKGNPYVPPIVLTSITQDGKPLDFGKAIENVTDIDLTWQNNFFEFEFAALNYTLPEKNQYKYMLKGLDKDWYNSGNRRFGRYTGVPDGTFELVIKGSNNDGIWNDTGKSVTIHITAPYWRTLWFRSLVFIVILCIVYGLFLLRMRAMKKQNMMLEQKVQERTLELVDSNKKLKKMSLTDPLTGLRNRRYFSNIILKDIAAANRSYRDWVEGKSSSKPSMSDITLLLIDIDHFKSVNDRFGHNTGDNVLVQVSAILNQVCRETDTVVRWGGEEFLILSRFSDRNSPDLTERIRRKFMEHDFLTDQGEVIKLTCSIGLASYPFMPQYPDCLDWEQVIAVADKALYLSKKSGRNMYVNIMSTSNDRTEGLFEAIQKDLKSLIDSGELTIQSSISDNKDIQFE